MATRGRLTQEEKDVLIARRAAGVKMKHIAEELMCSPETVKKWWRIHRKGESQQPVGRPARGVLSSYPAEIVEQAVRIKRAHPHWGPANVRLELEHELKKGGGELPSMARLSALFKDRCPEAVQPHRHQAHPQQPLSQARHPHQRWQIDGKEKVGVGEQDVVTILSVRDPVGALMIASQAFLTTTPTGWRKVTLSEVQSVLRAAFTEWGMPLEVQTDHEVVYSGSPVADFPSQFTLWLVGLGMSHIPSRDRRPTDQSQVERNHRTLGDMAWKDEHFNEIGPLQSALDDCRNRYNHQFPVRAANCQGQPPLDVYPWAYHSGRPYHVSMEWLLFDLARVDAYLAQLVWTRQVNSSGCVAIGNHLYYVARALARQTVSVRFIPDTRTFRFQRTDGTVVKQQPAHALDKADLIGFVPLDALPISFQLPLPLTGV